MPSPQKRWDILVEKWRKPAGLRGLLLVIGIVLLMGAITGIVYGTGGTAFAWLHLMYVPVLLAAFFFRIPGGLLAALTAGLLLGPLMPLSVPEGIAQETGNWLFRTLSFLLIGGLGGLVSQILNAQLDRERRRAYSDALTGLPNLLALERDVSATLAENDSSACLAVIVLTNFGQIMDALGYGAADSLELQVAARLSEANPFPFPAYKIHGASFAFLAANLDQDEFVQGCTGLVRRLQDPFDVEGVPVSVNMHCGIALLPRDAVEAHEGIQKASVAAHEAASNNKTHAVYNSDGEENRRQHVALLGSLRNALKKEELALYYQPKVNVRTGVIEGAEALLRWNHPEHGLVRPDLFVPEAEKTWLIQPLSLFAVKAVIAKLQKLRVQGVDIRLGVNLTAHNIQSGKFMAALNDLLDEADIRSGSLEIEITERTLITELDAAAELLNSLKKRGVGIAIDDVGAGYSVIRYLQNLPINSVKLDQIFMRDLLISDLNQNIVQGMIRIAKRMGFVVVAEGVENKEVSDKLKTFGCDLIQGYYVSRPLPEEEFDDWLRAGPYTLPPLAVEQDGRG